MQFFYGDNLYELEKAANAFNDCDAYNGLPADVSGVVNSMGLFTKGILLRLSGKELNGLDLNLVDKTNLVIIYQGLPDKRLKIVKHFLLKAQCKSFLLPSKSNLQALKKMVMLIGLDVGFKRIPDDVQHKLATHYGTDTLRIASELRKLFYAFGATIDISLVQVEDTSTVIFNLANYIVNKNVTSATTCVDTLTLQNEHPVKVLSILVTQFKEFLDHKLGTLGNIPSWKLSKLRTNRTTPELTAMVSKTFDALSAIKSGELFDLQTLVISLCQT